MKLAPSVDLRARLHRALSLSGVVGLGGFVVVHAAINASALFGRSSFDGAAHGLHALPELWLVEALFVFLPLLVHAALGVVVVLTGTALAPPRPYSPTVRVLVRVTGLGAAVFVASHLLEVRFRRPGVRLDGGELATVLAADLSSTWHGVPWRGALYLWGTACVVIHLALGVWGVLAAQRARSVERRWGLAVGAAGAALWAVLALIVLFHATGARPMAVNDRPPSPQEPCPVSSSSVR